MGLNERPPLLKLCGAAVITVLVGLTTVSCTGDDRPADDAAPPSAPSSGAVSSLTFEEAYRRLPMDGTDVLPITWDLSELPEGDEVLAARRSLTFIYWMRQSTEGAQVIPIGQFVFTERFYQKFLAPLAGSTDLGDPSIGPIWVKVMGVEKTGPDQSRVTFCADIGWWHDSEEKNPQVRKNRANVESYEMENVQIGDGERRWLANRQLDPDGDREAKYQAQCTKWAQHKP